METSKKLKDEQHESLQITGMTCAACALRVEKGLNKVEGVTAAQVNYALERASVKFDSAVVNRQLLEQAIEKIGYGTVPQAQDGDDQKSAADYREHAIQKQKRMFILAAIFTLPLLWSMVSHFSVTSWIWLL